MYKQVNKRNLSFDFHVGHDLDLSVDRIANKFLAYDVCLDRLVSRKLPIEC